MIVLLEDAADDRFSCMNKRTVVISVALVFLLFASVAYSKQMFYDMYILKYPGVVGSKIEVCVCHDNPYGGGSRNSFGEHFSKNQYDLGAIEEMDSDGDGWINIDEIEQHTHPGDKNDYPKDTTPPEIIIDKPANGEKFETNQIVIEGRAMDNKAVAKVLLIVTGQRNKNVYPVSGVWSAKYGFSKGGEITIKAIAYDHAGNMATQELSIFVIVPDEVPPIVEFIFPVEDATLESFPIVVKGRAIEEENSVELVEYSLDEGASWQEARGTDEWLFAINAAPEGRMIIKVRATDIAGNVSRAYTLKIFVKFADIPTPTISYPIDDIIVDNPNLVASGTLMSPAVKVKSRIGDGQWVDATVDGVFWQSEHKLTTPGKNTLEVIAYDIINRSSPMEIVSFVFEPRDSTPPVVEIENINDGDIFEIGYFVVEGTAKDSESEILDVEISTDGKTWTGVEGKKTWSKRLRFETPGRNTIYVRATDTFGNTSEPTTVTVEVLPELEFIFGEPDPDKLKEGELELEVTLNREVESEVTLKIAGAANSYNLERITSTKYKVTASLGAGKTLVTLEAFNNGKFSVGTKVISFEVSVNLTIGSVQMFVNGQIKLIPAPATIVDGRLYVPFRSLGEAWRAEVLWDGDTKTASFVLGDTTYAMTLGSEIARVNGKTVTMSNKPLIIGNRFMLPVRAVSEVLGAEVGYDAETRMATIVLK